MADKTLEVVEAIDIFVHNFRSYSDVRVTPELRVDDGLKIFGEEFKNKFQDQSNATKTMATGLIFSKWFLYKTIYRFEPGFLDVLRETENLVFYMDAIQMLPVPCFYIADPFENELGLVVYVERGNNEVCFFVENISDIKGESVNVCYNIIWIHDGQSLDDCLTEYFQAATEPIRDEGKKRIRDSFATAIQTAYYLSAQNAVIHPIKTKKKDRPLRKSTGHPLNLLQWEVGYRIGAAFPGKVQKENEEPGKPHVVTNHYRPHLRRAHWHHYRVGKGRQDLILKWIEPVFINGSEIIATEHQVS